MSIATPAAYEDSECNSARTSAANPQAMHVSCIKQFHELMSALVLTGAVPTGGAARVLLVLSPSCLSAFISLS